MPRPPRADEAGEIYHALNRGNARRTIFHKMEDYEAFERTLAEGLARYPVDLFAYQWMPNHWHMVLRPRENGAMSRLLYWVTMTHTARYHAHYGTAGQGHIYQGRFKSFPVEQDDYFLIVCRYVERNALAAGLVALAEDWRWGSLWNWTGGKSRLKLTPWPVPRLSDWPLQVNTPLTEAEQKQVHRSLDRSCPLGSEGWVESVARRLKLESTLRPRGRPRRFA
jgi:putative transposase